MSDQTFSGYSVPDRRLEEQAHELTWGWWLVMLAGALGVIAGVVVLAQPGNSLKALAVITGIFLLVNGICELVAALSRGRTNRGLIAVLGVVTMIVGVLLIRHPVGGVAAVAILIGIWLIAAGVVRFIAAFEEPGHRWGILALAAIEVIAGIVILANPTIGYATLAVITGIAFIAIGIGICAVGWEMHSVRRETA